LIMNDCRKSDYIIDEELPIRDLGQGTGTTTWMKGNNYILEGLVFVNDGQVLTIEPGTVIRALTGQGTAASALIVARGGKIIAEGTPSDPIIFTCEGDDLKGSVPVSVNREVHMGEMMIMTIQESSNIYPSGTEELI